MEQNREPGNKPMHIWSIDFCKGGKNIQWGKYSLINKWCWENWTARYKKLELDHCVTPYTSINSEWIEDMYSLSESRARGLRVFLYVPWLSQRLKTGFPTRKFKEKIVYYR